jgi:hypothetical protein
MASLVSGPSLRRRLVAMCRTNQARGVVVGFRVWLSNRVSEWVSVQVVPFRWLAVSFVQRCDAVGRESWSPRRVVENATGGRDAK